MLTALLIPLVALPATAPAIAPQAVDPTVRVWLSRTDVVWPGDAIRVYAEAQADGYLVVLHAEPDGRVRVLFPIDPGDDYFVSGGSRYEIMSRSNREAITVYAQNGVGTVIAAFSRDPFRFEELAQSGHWNYRAGSWWVNEDPESELLALADQMAGGVPFDYDVQRYGVSQSIAEAHDAASYGYAYPTYAYPASGVYLSAGFTFGVPFFGYSYSPVCWDWYYCYPGNWYYYGPYYRPYYSPYYYGYYGYYGYPAPYYNGYWRYPTYYSYDYKKYAGKGPAYDPGHGADYRRRGGAAVPANRVGAAGGTPETGRRTAGAVPGGTRGPNTAGQSGRRTAPAPAAPTAGGRRSAPVGAREAPAPSEGGRRTTGSQPAGGRAAPAKPTREATPGRRNAPASAGESRGTSRQSSQLPERVYPAKGSVPNTRNRGVDQRSVSGRDAASIRQPTGTRRVEGSLPERVEPSRSISMPQSMRRVTAEASAPAPERAAGSRSVNRGGRAELPTRVQSGAPRGAPTAGAPRAAPRAPAMSAPRAPAARAPAARAPAARAPAARAPAARAPAARARPSGRSHR